MCGIKLVPLTLRASNAFKLPRTHEIVKHITKRTKAMVMVNPNNPTGAVLTQAEQRRLVQITEQYHLFLIADETYREIVFTGKPTSLLSFVRGHDHVIVIDSASKRFSLPGARIGCLVSRNPAVMEAALRLAMTRLSAPTLEQHSLIPLLRKPGPHVRPIVREYRLRRDLAWGVLKQLPGVTCYKPQGAFYLMAELPISNTEDFVRWLLTHFRYRGATVLVAPAEGFYLTPGLGRNGIRLALVQSRPQLKRALTVLARGLAAYCKTHAT